MRQVFVEIKCDAPGCDTKIVLPLDGNGRPTVTSKEQLAELDRWESVHRNDGSTFDYCRSICHVNGVKLLAPINRNPEPETSPILSATGEPMPRDGGLILA
jgi:hypothetical protein